MKVIRPVHLDKLVGSAPHMQPISHGRWHNLDHLAASGAQIGPRRDLGQQAVQMVCKFISMQLSPKLAKKLPYPGHLWVCKDTDTWALQICASHDSSQQIVQTQRADDIA